MSRRSCSTASPRRSPTAARSSPRPCAAATSSCRCSRPEEMADRIGASAERSAILFGPERSGLETEDVALANAIVTVPINPEFGSLNLAQAVILLAYEWSRRSELAQPPARELEPPAPHAEIEGLIGQLEGELRPRAITIPRRGPRRPRTPSARSSPRPAGLRARSRPFVELFARWSILRAKDSCRAAPFVVIGRKYLDWGGIIMRLLLGVIGAGLVLAAGAAPGERILRRLRPKSRSASASMTPIPGRISRARSAFAIPPPSGRKSRTAPSGR